MRDGRSGASRSFPYGRVSRLSFLSLEWGYSDAERPTSPPLVAVSPPRRGRSMYASLTDSAAVLGATPQRRIHEVDATKSWDEALATLAQSYAAGEEAVRLRQTAWEPCASTVLLPTLKRAAEILQRNGLEQASAERYVLGTNIEAVQLYTGQEKGLRLLKRSGNDGSVAFVTEVGATLGYSLGVSGHVMRWFRAHWLTGCGADHPPWTELEMFEPGGLTTGLVEGHVRSFLKLAWATSYRGPAVASRNPIGFLLPQKED
jgi:hypothetical protein